MVKLRILGNRVLVKPEEGQDMEGAILLPETAKEKPQRGRVVAVGEGERNDEGELIPPDLQEGDRVVYAKYGGHQLKLDGEDHIILDVDQVYAKIVED